MRPVLLTVGKPGLAWADDAITEYAKRMRRWDGFELQFVKAEKFRGDIASVRLQEGERILTSLSGRDRLIAMDERGQNPDSHQFAALVDTCRQSGCQRLVFAVGGAYGLHEKVREKAWKTIRLSTMVLNHEVARVVLTEQVYRAYTILNRVPYHH